MEHIGPELSSGAGEEPLVGFEPTTARLRIESSTPELQWPVSLSMPWRGFEPRRLSALPPQDSVSTSFTTRATSAEGYWPW
jgi:hypothetical protein